MFSCTREVRLAGVQICLTAAALILVIVGLCWLYYGDAVPLVFLAKSIPLSTLPPEGRDEILGPSWGHLWATLQWHMPEIVLAFLALALFRSLSPVLRGAALGMLAFTLYHGYFVLPIMGYFGRFFAPMLPVLSLLALPAVEIVFRQSAIVFGFRGATLGGILLFAGLALVTAYKIVPTAVCVVGSHLPALESDAAINTKDGALTHVAHSFPFIRGCMVQMVQAMGDDCSIAATEDGLLSAYARHNRIVDYSGLHDRAIVREGFSADRLLLVSKPDVLTMPPRWYTEWSRAMESHPALERDYLMAPAFYEKGYPIAFRRDSACAARVRKAVYGR